MLTERSCISDDNGDIEMPPSLQAGDYDFLFSCNRCPQISAGDTPRTIEVRAFFSDASYKIIDHINVDIKPV